MCGIFGVINLRDASRINEDLFLDSLKLMSHRGPDGIGTRKIGERAILGHVRLSVIDISPESNQPLCVLDRYWITYNGELFNYRELRKQLEAHGVVFHTLGDTEVILQAYVQWGAKCVEKFNGMWAFAIMDTTSGDFFISRDRFGEKPLNYAIHEGQFLFASEIKSIINYKPMLARADFGAISNYCLTSVGAQHAQTWFQDIQRLPPGHNIVIKSQQIQMYRYWHYPERANKSISFDQACDEYRDLFEDAVRIRMRSDVPLGLTLSSGIDSTSIACMMHKINPSSYHAYTASFNNGSYLESERSPYRRDLEINFNESDYVEQLTRDIDFNAHILNIDESDFLHSMRKAIWHLESGNSSPAVFPLLKLFEYAKKEVKVILEGQGSDELLGGYIHSSIFPSVIDLFTIGNISDGFSSFSEYARVNSISYALKMSARNLSNNIPLISSIYQNLTGINAALGPSLRNQLRLKDYPDLNDECVGGMLKKTLLHQHSGGLVNLLHYGDAISMAYGIETRNPFLDHRLVEFVWALPSNYLVNKGVGKFLQREAMVGIVPDYILNNKNKFGFTTPIGRQFGHANNNTSARMQDVLLSDSCLSRGVFNPDALKRLLRVHSTGKKDLGNLLFRFACVELWFQIFIDNPVGTSQ